MYKLLKILCFFILLFIKSTSLLLGYTYYWGSHPDRERFVLKFDKTIPSTFKIFRQDKYTIKIIIPDEFLKEETIPSSKFVKNMTILKSVDVKKGTLTIFTHVPDFELNWFLFAEENKIVVDLIKKPYEQIKNEERNKDIEVDNDNLSKTTNKNIVDNSSSQSENGTLNNLVSEGNKTKPILKEIKYVKSFAVKGFVNKNATIYNPNKEYYPEKIENKKIENEKEHAKIEKKKILK